MPNRFSGRTGGQGGFISSRGRRRSRRFVRKVRVSRAMVARALETKIGWTYAFSPAGTSSSQADTLKSGNWFEIGFFGVQEPLATYRANCLNNTAGGPKGALCWCLSPWPAAGTANSEMEGNKLLRVSFRVQGFMENNHAGLKHQTVRVIFFEWRDFCDPHTSNTGPLYPIGCPEFTEIWPGNNILQANDALFGSLMPFMSYSKENAGRFKIISDRTVILGNATTEGSDIRIFDWKLNSGFTRVVSKRTDSGTGQSNSVWMAVFCDDVMTAASLPTTGGKITFQTSMRYKDI